MSRRSKKRKQREQNEKRNKQTVDKGPINTSAMEQAMRDALVAKGEALPETSSKSFSQSLQDIGKKIFGTGRSTDIPTRAPRPRGAETQFLKKSDSGDVELVIGLDFGTACTKVVIQDVATRTAYAVPFATGSDPTGTYLLPTIVSLDDHGNFNLDRRGTEFRGLKENLMNIAALDPADEDAKPKDLMPHTIAYLALAFREIRAWFMEEHEDDYKGRKILWRINVGLPASRFDHPHMPIFYRRTIRCAWYLSTISEQVSGTWASEVWNMDRLPDDGTNSLLTPDSIAAFPEVVAAVQGYAKSPERKEGIHLLVDVGASTLDVTCFRLHSHDHEDVYPIFFATVQRLGGFELFHHRADVVRNLITTAIDHYTQEMDGVTEPKNLLKLKFGLDEEEQLDEDRDFGNEVGTAIWRVIAETKSKKVPMAQEWVTSLPTFLCGGASRIDIYSQALKRIDENRNWQGSLDVKELTLPQSVRAPGISPALRQRLMVAYGLSFNQFDFGDLIPPSGIPEPEDDEHRKQYTDSFVTKDMV